MRRARERFGWLQGGVVESGSGPRPMRCIRHGMLSPPMFSDLEPDVGMHGFRTAHQCSEGVFGVRLIECTLECSRMPMTVWHTRPFRFACGAAGFPDIGSVAYFRKMCSS